MTGEDSVARGQGTARPSSGLWSVLLLCDSQYKGRGCVHVFPPVTPPACASRQRPEEKNGLGAHRMISLWADAARFDSQMVLATCGVQWKIMRRAPATHSASKRAWE